MRIFFPRRSPVERIVPNILERAFGEGGIGTFAFLPSVIYLEMSHSQTGGLFQFGDTELLIDLGILASVTPGIHHYHLVTVGMVLTDMLLIIPKCK